MVNRYYAGTVPEPGRPEAIDNALIDTAAGLGRQVDDALARLTPHEALAAIWELIGVANKYVVEVEPWVLARQRQAGGVEGTAAEVRLATTLYHLVETLRLIACACAPFLPATAAAIAHQLGLTATSGDGIQALTWGRYPAGTTLQPGQALFPRLEWPA